MWITGKRALVTGGTGSFGQFIVRRLLDLGATEIRIMSRDEKKHYDMRHHYANEPRIRLLTGDIRDSSAGCARACTAATWSSRRPR